MKYLKRLRTSHRLQIASWISLIVLCLAAFLSVSITTECHNGTFGGGCRDHYIFDPADVPNNFAYWFQGSERPAPQRMKEKYIFPYKKGPRSQFFGG